MKSYTDIEQSKKLAEILPLVSADMFYATNSDWEGKIIGLLDVPLYIGSDGFVDTEMGEIYAWSLAALLGVLHDYTLQTNTDGTVFVVCESKKPMISDAYDNPVDACVDIIDKLHQLNLL